MIQPTIIIRASSRSWSRGGLCPDLCLNMVEGQLTAIQTIRRALPFFWRPLVLAAPQQI